MGGSSSPFAAECSRVSVGEVDLDARRFGVAGTWVTLVHGGLVGAVGWRAQLPTVTKPNLLRAGRIMAYDQRGYGDSAPAGPHDIGTLAIDLIELWERLEIQRTVVVGFSLGGFVALDAAAFAPERIAGIVLEGCAEPDKRVSTQFAARAAAIEDGGSDVTAEHLSAAFSPAFLADQPEVVAEYGTLTERVDPAALAESFRSLSQWRLRDSHRELEAPLLMICGEHDKNFGPAARERMASQMEQVETATLRGAGHTAHLECSPGFNHLVVDFVGRIRE
jgi:3-oxoadipate enol-lactonase